MREVFFWQVPTLGWIDREGWNLEKVGWNKVRPVHGVSGLSTVIIIVYPWEPVREISARYRTKIEHDLTILESSVS